MKKKIIYWLWIAICSISAQMALAQSDTVYFTSSTSLITMTWKGSVKTIPADAITCDTGKEGADFYVYVNNGIAQAGRFRYNSFAFKINGVATTRNIDSIRILINALNTGIVPTFKLWKIIEVVSAIPSNPDPYTTYYVGRQTTIEFTGLDGDRDRVYKVEGWLIGDTTNDAMAFRVNGITTNNYDYGYGYVGSTSFQTANNANVMNAGSIQGKTAANQLDLYIEAETGKNRQFLWHINTIGVSQQVISRPLSGGGIWRNTSSNMTSLQFTCPSAVLMYGVGTKFRLYRLQ